MIKKKPSKQNSIVDKEVYEKPLIKKEWMLFNKNGFKTKDVAEAVEKLKEEDKRLMKQLIIDFKTPLDVKSAKRFIKGRFKMSNENKDKIMGKFK